MARSPQNRFPIIRVGASAGRLEARDRLLAGIPPDRRLAALGEPG